MGTSKLNGSSPMGSAQYNFVLKVEFVIVGHAHCTCRPPPLMVPTVKPLLLGSSLVLGQRETRTKIISTSIIRAPSKMQTVSSAPLVSVLKKCDCI